MIWHNETLYKKKEKKRKTKEKDLQFLHRCTSTSVVNTCSQLLPFLWHYNVSCLDLSTRRPQCNPYVVLKWPDFIVPMPCISSFLPTSSLFTILSLLCIQIALCITTPFFLPACFLLLYGPISFPSSPRAYTSSFHARSCVCISVPPLTFRQKGWVQMLHLWHCTFGCLPL